MTKNYDFSKSDNLEMTEVYTDPYLEQKCGGSFEKLARSWAPINYQYISLKNDDETKRDLLCTVNFGCYHSSNKNETKSDEATCWDTGIVRERLKKASFEELIPAAYYSAAVTDTHYYVLYAYYHADDSTHPNDLEGCLVILEKDYTRPHLLGMITVAHQDFVPYVYDNQMEITDNPFWQHGFDMEVEEELEGDHPLIQQAEGKHGLYALGSNIGFGEKFERRLREIFGMSQDVIVYYPGEKATPYNEKALHKGKGNPHNPTFYYELIDMLDKHNGLYDKYIDAQNLGGNSTFTKDGAFHSLQSLGNANGPWLWEPLEIIDDRIKKGAMWNDPEGLVRYIFKPKGKQFSDKTKYLKRMNEKCLSKN